MTPAALAALAEHIAAFSLAGIHAMRRPPRPPRAPTIMIASNESAPGAAIEPVAWLGW